MRIVRVMSWNMNFWRNTRGKVDRVIEWKKNCVEYLRNEKDIDFYLLQEINPFKLFETLPNQYYFSISDYNILYHELYNELPEKFRGNPWGNAILFKKSYSMERNNIDMASPDKKYYGRNVVMCYDFKSDGKAITIANIYNKGNNGDYSAFLKYFKKDSDIQDVLKRNGNFILAGDFNTYAKKDNGRLENLEQELNTLSNCAKKEKRFKETYYDARHGPGIDDFCFASKNIADNDKTGVTIPDDKWDNKQDKDHRWNGLSDHCPIIVDFDL